MVKCRTCGMDLRPGARFCDRCGTKVEKICPACGAVLRDQARFCDLCGVPLERAVPVSRPKAQKGGIAAGQLHTVAFRADGKVLATGNNDFGQCDVSSWSDVVGVACGKDFTVAVRADGTALAAGNNQFGQCDLSGWTNLNAVAFS